MAEVKLTMFFKKTKFLYDHACAFNPIVCACIVREHISKPFVLLCGSLFWCSL